jgi:hypothetical protein
MPTSRGVRDSMPGGRGMLSCPACGTRLIAQHTRDQTAVQVCSLGHGMWIDSATAQALRGGAAKQRAGAARPAAEAPMLGVRARPLRCPVCGEFMSRDGQAGGIAVAPSECRLHGYWIAGSEASIISESLGRDVVGGDALGAKLPSGARRAIRRRMNAGPPKVGERSSLHADLAQWVVDLWEVFR